MIAFLTFHSLLLFIAEQAGEKGFFQNPDIWRPLNALLFLIILIYIFRKKLRLGRMFDERAATIQRELEQARREKEAAQERLSQVEERLKNLDQEIAEIRAEAEREAAQEAERVRQAASADAEKIEQIARREMDGAMKAARAELRAFVADHSVQRAEAIIRREISPEDNSRIISEYVDDLQEVNK